MEQNYLDMAAAREELDSPSSSLLKAREFHRQQLLNPAPVEPSISAAPAGTPSLNLTPTPPLPKESAPILPSAGEAMKAVPGGVLQAAKGFVETVRDVVAAARQSSLDESAQEIADTHGLSIEEARKEAELSDPLGQLFIKSASKLAEGIPQTEEPASIGGSMLKQLAAFLTPFLPIAKGVRATTFMQALLKGGGKSKAGQLASKGLANVLEGALAGAPAQAIAFDPQSPRFSNLLQSLSPSMKNVVTDFLKAPELPESEELAFHEQFKERLKGAAEGVLFGAPLDLLSGVIIGSRQFARMKAATRKFNMAVEAARGEQRAGERAAIPTVEEVAGPLAHDRRAVTLPVEQERRAAVQPLPEVQAAERELSGQPAEAIEAEINRRMGVSNEAATDNLLAEISQRMTPGDLSHVSVPKGALAEGEGASIMDALRARAKPQTMAQRLDAAADAVNELHQANGGSTFNLRSGDLGGQEAYAVGFAPDLSERIPGHPTRDQIRAFTEKVSALIPLDDERISIGTFFENGFTDLDVVFTPRTMEEAVAAGKAFNQRSVFDLKNFKVIETGGTGLDPGNLPSLKDRLDVIFGANGPRVFPQAVHEVAERNGEAARQGLWQSIKNILRDETGAIRIGTPENPMKPGELRQFGFIGAAALARGQKSKDAFREAIEGAFSVGGRLRFADADVDLIRVEAEKVFERNVRSALQISAKLSKELGDENTYHGLPHTGRILQLFNDGKFALGWYDGANTELRRWFGKDADMMVDLIAATSPRTNPQVNVQEAIDAYIALKQGKPVESLAFRAPAGNVKRALVQRVIDGLPIDTPKAGAFAKNIKGDPNAVTIDTWMFRAFFGTEKVGGNSAIAKGKFMQEWVRQAAYAAGVQPREFQAAVWTGIRMENDFLFEGATEFDPLRKIIAEKVKAAVDAGTLELPPDLMNDAGYTRMGMLWFLSRVSAGALYGASGKDISMEDRISNALVAAGVAGALSPTLFTRLVGKMAGVVSAEKAIQAPRHAGRSSAALGIASEPLKPEAHSFASLAEEYAARVKAATRGEVINEETGLVTVRPRDIQTAEAATIRGEMTPEAIQQLMPTIRMNDAESIAMAETMSDVGLKVQSLALSAKQGGYKEADIKEFLKELYLMGRMDPKRLGALAESGRTLGALNDPVAGMNDFLNQFSELLKSANSTVTPQRMVDAIASFHTPAQLATFAKQLTKPGFKDYFFEVWINSLLSGPKTLIVNGLGNTAFLLYNVGERGLAASLRSGDGVAPGEASAMLHGIVEAHSDALRAFWNIVREADEIPEAASKIEQPRKVITAENLNMTGVPGRAVDLLGSAIRTPGKILAGTDEYFKAIASRAQIRALARREAFNEVERLGLEGSEAVAKMHEIEMQFLQDPPLRALQQARNFAEYTTFTSELGETGHALQALQKTAFGRLVIPFVRTPLNLAKAGLERSGPLGLASSRIRTELASADAAVRDLAKAKLALSSMTLTSIGLLAANGYVTGGGPMDPQLRAQWLAAGYQPYSFDVGAMKGRVGPPQPGDLIQFNRIDPIAMPFGVMADIVNMMGHLPPDEQEELATAVVIAFSKNFTSKTWVQGVARTTAAMADPERMGGQYVQNLLASMMPFGSLSRQAATALDPELKDAQGIVDEFMRRIPGLSKNVPGDLDLFGNPRFLGGGLGSDIVSDTFKPAVDFVMPIYISSATKKHQAIFAELNKNTIRTAETPNSIDGVKLSNWEKHELKKIAGQEVELDGMKMPDALKALFSSPAYQAAAPGRGEGREALVNVIIRGYYEVSKPLLLERRKDLNRAVQEKRVERMRSLGADPEQVERAKSLIGVE